MDSRQSPRTMCAYENQVTKCFSTVFCYRTVLMTTLLFPHYTAVLCHFVTVRKISAVISAVRFFAPHSTNDSTFRTTLQHLVTMTVMMGRYQRRSGKRSATAKKDARVEGTTTRDEVYDVCFSDSFTHGKQFVLGGRSCVRVSTWSLCVVSTRVTCVYP